MVECILAYSEFIDKIKDISGNRAFLEDTAPRYLIDWIYRKIQLADVDALKEGSFWSDELKRFMSID